MSAPVNTHDAKTHFSALLHRVEQGAIAEDLTIVTSDRAFRQYPVEVVW